MLKKSRLPLQLASLLAVFTLTACSEPTAEQPARPDVPWVKTVAVANDGATLISLSGAVRARYETPIAFQVGGRILARHVDAGQRVSAGQKLFSLDPRDLKAAERVASAQVAAAEAELATAKSELERQRQLVEQQFVSAQALARFELAVNNASSQRDAAQASLAQARNALNYAELHAEHAGVLIEVTGEPGQVVGQGQAIGLLAHEGDQDIEVFLADGSQPPKEGRARLPNGGSVAVELREVAGAADQLSRTWRARYRVLDKDVSLPLGMVVQIGLSTPTQSGALVVPLGALDERAGGPRIWRVVDHRAEPVPVEILTLGPEHARIRAELAPDTRVIALGTHLLTPGMAVREHGQ